MVKRVKFQCSDPSCKKLFETESKRDTHEKLVHKRDVSVILTEPENPLQCKVDGCTFEGKNVTSLRMHTTRKHGKNWSGKPSRMQDGTPKTTNKDAESALVKITKENIRLNQELETVNDKLYHMYVKYEPLDGSEPPANVSKSIVSKEFEQYRIKLFGDSNGATPDERLGLIKAYEIATAANQDLLEQVKQAKAGLIPEQWLETIKAELEVSMAIVIEGMKDTVKERSKVVKYDKMMEMLKEATDE